MQRVLRPAILAAALVMLAAGCGTTKSQQKPAAQSAAPPTKACAPEQSAKAPTTTTQDNRQRAERQRKAQQAYQQMMQIRDEMLQTRDAILMDYGKLSGLYDAHEKTLPKELRDEYGKLVAAQKQAMQAQWKMRHFHAQMHGHMKAMRGPGMRGPGMRGMQTRREHLDAMLTQLKDLQKTQDELAGTNAKLAKMATRDKAESIAKTHHELATLHTKMAGLLGRTITHLEQMKSWMEQETKPPAGPKPSAGQKPATK